MARGQAAQDQLNKTNAVGDTQQKKAGELESQLIPGYTSLMNTGYMSPEQEAAATTSEMGAATEPFEAAGFQAANRAGATNNASDLTANEDQLALEKGRTAGEAAANLQEEKMRNEEAGMYGLGQLKAQDQGQATSMYGLGPSTLQAKAALSQNPFLELLKSGIGAGGAIGASAVAPK